MAKVLKRSSMLDEKSLHLRRLMLRALEAADKGHVGSALSLIEIFRVLYERVAKHDPARPTWEQRDRIILSKGHGCLALFAVLADQGYFPVTTLDTFCKRHSPLGGHPERDLKLGIEASTGALGHGLPFAVGIALAHQMLQDGVQVFVIVGDGELNEGSNWEALLIASKHHLRNLTVIVDCNAEQLGGPIEEIQPMEPLRGKFEAFGALTFEADGHRVESLLEAFDRAGAQASETPRAIICHTIKGKGLAFAERNPAWHYKAAFGPKGIQEIAEHLATTQSLVKATRPI